MSQHRYWTIREVQIRLGAMLIAKVVVLPLRYDVPSVYSSVKRMKLPKEAGSMD
jgi:hypothetical protein